MNNVDHTLTLSWVEQATCQFINASEMREAFSLAVAAGVNLIFSGPGGHGKSEFLTAAFGAIEHTEPYVKSFGQGTSTDELYGGLDFDALDRRGGEGKATLQYNPELSFLNHHIAVFEELFDAPPRVLTSLKDTLTSKRLRNGHQQYDMQTRVIAAATNHSPQDIAEGGPEIAALIERFPVQLEVKWETYDESSYMELFSAVTDEVPVSAKVSWESVAALQERTSDVTISKTMRLMLSRIIVRLRHIDGIKLSPRTAVLAMKLAQAAATINGRSNVVAQDLLAIAFLPGTHQLKSQIDGMIAELALTMGAEEELERLEGAFADTAELFEFAQTTKDLDELTQTIDGIYGEVDALQVGTETAQRRSDFSLAVLELREKVSTKLDAIQLESTLDEQRQELDAIPAKIKQATNKLRYSTGMKGRHEAQDTLGAIAMRLVSMSLHPSLEEQREILQMQVNTARMN